MPEPLLYLKAMGTAAIVSAIAVLAMLTLRKWLVKSDLPGSAGTTSMNSACVVGIGLGLAAGYYVLSLQLAWPPTSGLERLLTIVVPAALCIELIAAIPRFPRTIAWLLRMSLAVMIPRVLLHGSVYLSDSGDWTLWQAGVTLAACGVLLAGVWSLLLRLSARSPGVSIPYAVCMTLLCAGATVMMAGYIKGGASTLPLVSTLLATTIAAKLATKRFGAPSVNLAPINFDSQAVLGIGVVGLFGVLFIGRFFGEISSSDAIIMLLAPLLCWVTETRLLRNRKPWIVGSLRLMLVAIPLVVVLIAAKRDFDREMAPLLVNAGLSAIP